MTRPAVRTRFAPAAGVLGFLVLWQVFVRLFEVTELPAPWDVIRHIASDPEYYWRNGRRTAWNAALGFLLGLVTGIGGGVSTFALQIAKQLGANVFVTSGNEEKIERAREMGADGGANYKLQDWGQMVVGMTDGDGPDVVRRGNDENLAAAVR